MLLLLRVSNMRNPSLSRLFIGILTTFGLLSGVAHAAFPDDFEGVVWIDPAEVATWPQTGER